MTTPTTTRLEDVGSDGYAAAIRPHPSIPTAVRVMVAANGKHPERNPGLWIDLDARELVAAVRAAQPADEAAPAIDVAHLERQRTWSRETFGPGPRTAGVLDHIRKELLEIEADPADLGEWVDLIILALDGAYRAGHEPADIIVAVKAKQARNEARTWPDWRTAPADKAIEHDRTADVQHGDGQGVFAPVVDDDPGCVTCGRDNRNGTHTALERTGHLSHPFTVKEA